MSGDHLPECYMAEPAIERVRNACICDRLRACEARVRDEYRWLINKSATAVDETLDAARDAVAALRAPGYEPWGEFIYREVLPAIDALRGES